MLHLIPQAQPEEPPDYGEAVSRLASIRHALRLVDGGFSEGPSDDLDDQLASAFETAGEPRQRWFERRSGRLVGQTAAGIEALLGVRHQGHEPHGQASRRLVDEIRRELRDVAGIVLA